MELTSASTRVPVLSRLNGSDLSVVEAKAIELTIQFKIQTKSARINAFKYSFFVRIIKEWNNLPNHLFGHDINDINANRFKSMKE